jgi:hypothetical protein
MVSRKSHHANESGSQKNWLILQSIRETGSIFSKQLNALIAQHSSIMAGDEQVAVEIDMHAEVLSVPG